MLGGCLRFGPGVGGICLMCKSPLGDVVFLYVDFGMGSVVFLLLESA